MSERQGHDYLLLSDRPDTRSVTLCRCFKAAARLVTGFVVVLLTIAVTSASTPTLHSSTAVTLGASGSAVPAVNSFRISATSLPKTTNIWSRMFTRSQAEGASSEAQQRGWDLGSFLQAGGFSQYLAQRVWRGGNAAGSPSSKPIVDAPANNPSQVDDWYTQVFTDKQDGPVARKRPIVDEEEADAMPKKSVPKVMPRRAPRTDDNLGHDNFFKLGGVTHYQGAVSELSLGSKVVLHAEGDSKDDCSAVRVTPLGSDQTIGYIPTARCSLDPDLTKKAYQLIRCGKGIARVSKIDDTPTGIKDVTINIQLDDVALQYVRMIIQLHEQKRSRRRQSRAVPAAIARFAEPAAQTPPAVLAQ